MIGVPPSHSQPSLSDVTTSTKKTIEDNCTPESEEGWDDAAHLDALLAALPDYDPTNDSTDRYFALQQARWDAFQKKKAEEEWKTTQGLSLKEQAVLDAVPTTNSKGRTYPFRVNPQTRSYNIYQPLSDNEEEEEEVPVEKEAEVENYDCPEPSPNNDKVITTSPTKDYNINIAEMYEHIQNWKKTNKSPRSSTASLSTTAGLQGPLLTSLQKSINQPTSDLDSSHNISSNQKTVHFPHPNELPPSEHRSPSEALDQLTPMDIIDESTENLPVTDPSSSLLYPPKQNFTDDSLPNHHSSHLHTTQKSSDNHNTYIPTDKTDIWHTTIEFPMTTNDVKHNL